MKKIYKILLGILLLVLAAIFVIPMFFEDKIIEFIKNSANENINATLDFKDADLSIFRSFPNAEVRLEKVSLVNKAPFVGDTLCFADRISLQLPVKQLLGGISNLSISHFEIDRAKVNVVIDKNGKANYDIFKENQNKPSTSKNKESLNFQLTSYGILNSEISYKDAVSKMELKLKDFNHSGSGNLSTEKSKLQTETHSMVSFTLDSIQYLTQNQFALKATLGIDLTENTYTFLENELQINQLPIVFEGFVKLNEDNQQMNLKFRTPSSDFENFLALIPKHYSKSLEGVTTTGDFVVSGEINGIMDQDHIPPFEILIHSKKASFKYPDLPKTVENIQIHTEIGNKSGLVEESYVVVDTLTFKIDEDTFNASARITDLTQNQKVDIKLLGNINLGNLEKVYPAEEVKNLKGKLYVNAKTGFDRVSIEKKQYDKIKVSGVFNVENFVYQTADFKNPLEISKAGVTLFPEKVILNDFNVKTGQTDLSIQGKIDNFLGFIFNKEEMEGDFDLASTKFVVNDFMSAKPKDTLSKTVSTNQENFKIPAYLNAKINVKANTLIYDDIVLENVSGTLNIKDQQASLEQIKSSAFDGWIGFSGRVNTQEEISSFEMNLNFDHIDVAESFSTLNLFRALVPIATAMEGQLNSNIKMQGNLTEDLIPNLNSLSGSVSSQLISSNLATEKVPLIQLLEQNLQFLNVKELNLDNVKMDLNFEEGKVLVKPFSVNFQDIKLDVSGGHGFDNSMDYKVNIHLPAKYLGKDASKYIAQLSDQEIDKIEIPVNALITGSFKNPKVKTDLEGAITTFTQQLAIKQKDKLIEQGTEKVSNLLDDLIRKNEKAKDSIQKDSVKTKKSSTEAVVKDVLNSIFKTKKKNDSLK